MTATKTDPFPGLGPGARLLRHELLVLADDRGEVHVPSGDLLARCGWQNRVTLRRRVHDLVNAGIIEVRPTFRADGGRGPNVIVLRELTEGVG